MIDALAGTRATAPNARGCIGTVTLAEPAHAGGSLSSAPAHTSQYAPPALGRQGSESVAVSLGRRVVGTVARAGLRNQKSLLFLVSVQALVLATINTITGRIAAYRGFHPCTTPSTEWR